MRNLKKSLYAAWLGGTLTLFTNLNWFDWQLYAIIIPTVVLVVVFYD
jgi:hypothetical protein